IYYNAFYEEESIAITTDLGAYFSSPVVNLTYTNLNYKIIAGQEKTKDGEYVLVFPEDSGYYDIIREEGIEFGLFENKSKHEMIGKIVGFATAKDINAVYLQCYSSYDERLLEAVEKNYWYHRYYYMDGKQYDLPYASSSRTYISCPKAYEGEDISFVYLLKGIYEVPWDIEVVYEDKEIMPTLHLNSDSHPDVSNMEIYEAVIYTDSVHEVKSQLEHAGYRVTVPSEVKVKASVLNLITLYLFLTLTIMALICLFFISYVILARVYASKNKDYGVLRTLGMVKKQLGRIVILEVIAIGCIATLLSLILFIILYHTTTAFSMGDYMNFGILLLYFILMLLFSYFIARRFNRRLYKFSVNTTVKGEVARND
ncbi:MAG: FtsX-like permease family protein, partial [Anaeroplasmataceae bacterium]|nr:FtsX-like permease family protein [Anaeroplasmataceae bacterium]